MKIHECISQISYIAYMYKYNPNNLRKSRKPIIKVWHFERSRPVLPTINYSKKYNCCMTITLIIPITTHPITKRDIFSKCPWQIHYIFVHANNINAEYWTLSLIDVIILVAQIGLICHMCYHVLGNYVQYSLFLTDYVFCHADDLLFTSLTETGFQKNN